MISERRERLGLRVLNGGKIDQPAESPGIPPSFAPPRRSLYGREEMARGLARERVRLQAQATRDIRHRPLAL
jgi:hypothetical protein